MSDSERDKSRENSRSLALESNNAFQMSYLTYSTMDLWNYLAFELFSQT